MKWLWVQLHWLFSKYKFDCPLCSFRFSGNDEYLFNRVKDAHAQYEAVRSGVLRAEEVE